MAGWRSGDPCTRERARPGAFLQRSNAGERERGVLDVAANHRRRTHLLAKVRGQEHRTSGFDSSQRGTERHRGWGIKRLSIRGHSERRPEVIQRHSYAGLIWQDGQDVVLRGHRRNSRRRFEGATRHRGITGVPIQIIKIVLLDQTISELTRDDALTPRPDNNPFALSPLVRIGHFLPEKIYYRSSKDGRVHDYCPNGILLILKLLCCSVDHSGYSTPVCFDISATIHKTENVPTSDSALH